MSKAITLINKDCRKAMKKMEANSIDAIVCDPPYELGFMGKSWDQAGVAFDPKTWKEALRVLKPGGHLLAFGGTRTFHRLAVAIEDAGFEIRDCLSWMYGSGFPKSLDVSKAIDKAAGAKREVVGTRTSAFGDAEHSETGDGRNLWVKPATKEVPLTGGPVTPEAERWNGWGTALKPAWEPIIVARKPLVGTVAANVLAHGTGALNIDATRIATTDNLNGGAYAKQGSERHDGTENWRYKREGGAGGFEQPEGRWPANVILDKKAGKILDEQTGTMRSGVAVKRNLPDAGASQRLDFKAPTQRGEDVGYGDSGGASRFFYCAKASKKERNEGLPEGMVNNHPTVKPVAVMAWLVRLVTPPGGVVLDPFMGSGTTGVAVVSEGFRFVGIDNDTEHDYIKIAKFRIKHAKKNRKK